MSQQKDAVKRDKLVEVSKHLHYETTMLRRNLETLRSMEANQNKRLSTVKYSFVESFLIHARNLYEFLYCDKKFEDSDVRAGDFLQGGIWKKPPIPPDLKRWYRERIDKRVVHLTYDRLSVEEFEHQWQIGAMFAGIERGLLMFYQKVQPENLCLGLQDEREHALLEEEKRKVRPADT